MSRENNQNWVETLFNAWEVREAQEPKIEVNLSRDKTKALIKELFAYQPGYRTIKPLSNGPQAENKDDEKNLNLNDEKERDSEFGLDEKKYQLKGFTDVSGWIYFNESQMRNLLSFLSYYEYDGLLHRKEENQNLVGGVSNPPILGKGWLNQLEREAKNFFGALRKNFHPTPLSYQMLNLLEVTGWMVFFRTWDIEFPMWTYAISLAPLAMGVMRNNHYYNSAVVDLSVEDREAFKGKVTQLQEQLRSSEHLKTLGLNNKNLENLLGLLTKPSKRERIFQELAACAGFLVKLGAAMAVISNEFKDKLSPALCMVLGLLAGMVEGVDTAYTKAIAIGGEHKSIVEYRDGIVPTVGAFNRAPIFSQFADLGPLVWLMAKVGPILWPIVRLEGAFKFLEFIGVDELRGGNYGYAVIAGISALLIADVFSQYNIDQKLGKDLPTKRDFLYNTITCSGCRTNLSTLGKAFVGSLGPAVLIGYPLYRFANNTTLTVTFPIVYALAATLGLIFPDEGDGNEESICGGRYRKLFEMRWVIDVLRYVDDAVKSIDRPLGAALTLVAASALFIAYGDDWGLASKLLGLVFQPVTYLFLTGMIPKSSITSAIRFSTVQTGFYGAALIKWILDVVYPLFSSDRLEVFDRERVGNGVYWPVVILTILASFAAGAADFYSQGAKLPPLMSDMFAPVRLPSQREGENPNAQQQPQMDAPVGDEKEGTSGDNRPIVVGDEEEANPDDYHSISATNTL